MLQSRAAHAAAALEAWSAGGGRRGAPRKQRMIMIGERSGDFPPWGEQQQYADEEELGQIHFARPKLRGA